MKIKSDIWQVTSGRKNRPARGAHSRHPSPVIRHSQKGIALVVTLILLSVTLVMALAFMAISSRERGAVTTTTDAATARLAAGSALANVEAQIVSTILATTNPYNSGLVVSTNYVNGFAPGVSSFTNVNYQYPNGNPLSAADLLINLTNLFYSPRPPVFIVTNSQTGAADFRFYLDLNRNGFDPSGFVTNVDNFGNVIKDAAGNAVTNFQVGDPQWIGVLERPDAPHGPDNKFLARYAFVAMPAGNALDVNAIYNQAVSRTVNPAASGSDGYLRNQGVGSWEINLAAFLADLNTNEWNAVDSASPAAYHYNEASPVPTANTGYAFADALSLLSYRLAGNYGSLASVQNLYGATGFNAFELDGIDGYSDGPLQTNYDTNEDFFIGNNDNPALSWAGADNTNHFYSPDDFFDTTKTALGLPAAQVAAGNDFTGRLLDAATNYFGGNTNSTYNRYTFYRLLAQLGTDSSPEQGMMNLNYDNLDPGLNGVLNVNGTASATNFVPWTPLGFFTNAADRMLRLYTTNWFLASLSTNLNTVNTNAYLATYYGLIYTNQITVDPFGQITGLTNAPYFGVTNQIPAFGISNIPVYFNGQFVYSPAVQRVLQLAANIYDASTNSFYPSVFRPTFWATNESGNRNIYINGYECVSQYAAQGNTLTVGNAPLDPPLTNITDLPLGQTAGLNFIGHNVYGVPWIVGAKKYLPGFNQFSMVNAVQVQRLLQIGRLTVGGPVWTNHQYLMTIANNLGASFWNSYANNYPTNYPGGLNIYLSDTVQMVLTNSDGTPERNLSFTTNFNIHPTFWPGSQWSASGGGLPATGSFITTNWALNFLPQEIYKTGAKTFAFTTDPDPFETNNHSCDPLPQFGLLTTNWVQAFILDGNHVVDYVQLRGPIDGTNLNNVLADPNYKDQTGINYMWSTNVQGNGTTPSYGIVNQVNISSGIGNPPSTARWNNPTPPIPALDSVTAMQKFFAATFTPSSIFTYNGIQYTNTELAVQAGYTASRIVYAPYLYQVNDPLVHYLASDLNAGAGAQWAGPTAAANAVWAKNDAATNLFNPPILSPPTIDIIKGRYQPWGKVAPNSLLSQTLYNFGNPYNLIYKDPLVWSPDYWDFPTNKFPTVGWLGRVHRGSPWQTVYLKAHDVLGGNASNIAAGTNTWAAWMGDGNAFDAANSAPVQDRLLFDLFTTAPDDNASRGQLSVNVGAPNGPSLAAWSALFSGMVALTNNSTFPTTFAPPTTTSLIIQPAGVNGLNSALGNLVTNINNMRAVFTNADGVAGMFEHKGDILSTLALTENSPFINTNSAPFGKPTLNQFQFGISDELYEWLPQQMMSLLRGSSSPRYVIYCYGQSLKPAPNGTYLGSGAFFGMVTNYQVTAESAVRVVLRVDDARTSHPHAVVESYNVLPPD
jgi:hypothetical protein